jgi:hypothetical protein
MRFSVGLDLGQREDYSALSVLEQIVDGAHVRYECRYLERYPLGTPYPRIVRAVGDLLPRPPLVKQSRLVIDASGVGVAVCDMFREAGMPHVAVTITGGVGWHREGRHLFVSKSLLVSTIQKFLSCEALGISKHLAEAGILKEELRNFRVKISKAANEIYEAREGSHDDVILSVAVALFVAEHPGPRFVPIGD